MVYLFILRQREVLFQERTWLKKRYYLFTGRKWIFIVHQSSAFEDLFQGNI